MNLSDVLRRKQAHKLLLYTIPRLEREVSNFQPGYPKYAEKTLAVDAAWDRFYELMGYPPDSRGWYDR